MVVDEFEERRLLGLLRKPAMGRSVVLSELADLLHLPAAHRLGAFFVTGIGCQLLDERLAADGGAIELEIKTPMHFRSGEAVGGRRADGPALSSLRSRSSTGAGPVWETVSAGTPRLPVPLSARGAGAQIVAVDPVEAAATEAQFRGRFARWQSLTTETCQDITNEGGGVATAQLLVVFSSREGKGWERERIFY